MWKSGLLGDGNYAYCRAQLDPRFQYDTPQNEWPPLSVGPGAFYRTGYSFRPTVNWASNMPDGKKFTRLWDVKSLAIASCVTGIPTTSTGEAMVEPPHKGQITVLYGDQSVHSMPAEPVLKILANIQLQSPNPLNNNYLSNGLGLWPEYDKNKQ